MQKAITILSHEEGLSKNKRERFRRYIHEVCGPEQDFYDDDNTTVGGEDLQKVTIQIKVCERTDASDDFQDYNSYGGAADSSYVIFYTALRRDRHRDRDRHRYR